ncbi:histidine phosphatase family protein [Thiovibrio sp. JS02]
MQTTIHLIRHGVTAANKENIFAGRSNEPLHADGIAQVTEVGRSLAQAGIGKIFCGPLPRTRQSAEIVAAMLRAGVFVEEGFNEIAIPHWDGLTKDEIRAKFGPEYPTWLDDPPSFSVAGCETIAHVQKRAVGCVERLFRECAGRNILVVSHLIVIRSLLLHYLGRPISEFRSIKVGNAQVTSLVRDETGVTRVVGLG